MLHVLLSKGSGGCRLKLTDMTAKLCCSWCLFVLLCCLTIVPVAMALLNVQHVWCQWLPHCFWLCC